MKHPRTHLHRPRPETLRRRPGYTGAPFNPERRHQLKSELDAYYARLYGLTRDELRCILDPTDVMGAKIFIYLNDDALIDWWC